MSKPESERLRVHNLNNMDGRLFKFEFDSNEPRTHEVYIWSDVNGWLPFMTITVDVELSNERAVTKYHKFQAGEVSFLFFGDAALSRMVSAAIVKEAMDPTPRLSLWGRIKAAFLTVRS